MRTIGKKRIPKAEKIERTRRRNRERMRRSREAQYRWRGHQAHHENTLRTQHGLSVISEAELRSPTFLVQMPGRQYREKLDTSPPTSKGECTKNGNSSPKTISYTSA
jgi:hypothetical protein